MLRILASSIGLSLVLVASVLGQATLPTPESVLGHRPGDDFYLATYDESMDYFRHLAAASDRVELRTVGRTSMGLEWTIALISSPENLVNSEEIRATAQRLAHPEGLSDAEARALARNGKAVVHIDGGLHATEVAHAQHTIQLAYDLASETSDPEILAILDNVLLILWPSINPDGQNMVVDWYRSNLGTPFEVAPLPRLYQKYIGHDNNRDGYMLSVPESRVSTRVIRSWEPQILYNHHQTAPFPARIWIPPFAEPISEFVHPLMWRTVNLLGMSMAQALEERGQEGAMHMGTGFDNWYPGFIDHAHNFHNVAALLTETGLYRYATPHFYTVDDFPPQSRELRPQSLYASPWQGGWWRLGDAVDYMLTASISVLDIAAKYREDLLYNRYQAGRDVIQTHGEDPPYAYFVRQEQSDPVAAVELLRRLAFNGIAIDQLQRDIEHQGQSYSAGTWVVEMQQPFANFVRQLFAIQDYPDLRAYPEGPPDQPYDVAGWTLPLQMGVHVVGATEPLSESVRAALQPVTGTPLPWDDPTADAATFDSPRGVGFDTHPVAVAIQPPAGRIEGNGSNVVLDAAQNNSYRFLHQAANEGASIAWQPGAEGASGGFVVRGLPGDRQQDLARSLAVQANRTSGQGLAFQRPRVALYRPHAPSMDEGWTRWLLERFDVPFTNVGNARIRSGRLTEQFDVLLIADIRPNAIDGGFPEGSVPPRYAGGLGEEGARALLDFVRRGGTLVTLNQASRYAIDKLHLPVRDVTADLPRSELFLGGSLVELEVDVSHPLMAGMDSTAITFVESSPVFAPEDEFEGSVLASYPRHGTPLVSGYLLGEEYIQGWAAALEVEVGDGHVVLLGLRPQWRAQPFGSFRLLFNALLYGRSLAAHAPESSEFWEAPEEEQEEDAEAEGE